MHVSLIFHHPWSCWESCLRLGPGLVMTGLGTPGHGVCCFLCVLSFICWLKHLQRDYTWPCPEERWCCVCGRRQSSGNETEQRHLDCLLMEQVIVFKTRLWINTSLPTRIKCFLYAKEGRSLEVDKFIVLFYCWDTYKKITQPAVSNKTPHPPACRRESAAWNNVPKATLTTASLLRHYWLRIPGSLKFLFMLV